MKRPTIEGLPSPAVRVSNQGDAASPAMQLDLARSVRAWPRLAGGVALGVFLVLVLYGLTRTKMYQAESLTYIEPMAAKVLSDGTSGVYDPSRYDSYIQQQMQTALRPDILEAALGKLPPHTWQRPGESMQSAVARLQSSLKVQRVLTSYQLSIDLTDANPNVAAAVVNAVTNAYLEEGRKDEHAVIDQRLKLLGEERARIQQQLGEDRVEQAQLGRELGFATPTAAAMSQYDAQIAGVATQVAGAREARDIAAAQLAAAQGPGMQALAEEQLQTDPGLSSMRQTVSARKAVLSTQMAGLTPSNPIYKQDEAEIADLDRSLDAMTAQARDRASKRLADKMRSDVARTADIEGRLNAQLHQQTATATNAAPKLQRASELSGELERLTARYTVVDDAIRSLELESNGPGSAHLSVAASVPVMPEPNKRKLILLLALPLAVFAGLAAAVLARRFDPKVWAGSDVERVLGFQPIGVMPARGEVSARVMEEYRLRLAAGLESALRMSSAQSFVFTAASPAIEIGEFVQAMERILGSLGFKTLVMDAAAVLQATRGGREGGREVAGARGLMRTIEGSRQGYATEELERLKAKYDLLLIDAAPLLHSAETEYLVRCADATILVAESGVTVKTELFQSAVLLQQLNVAGVGAVLQELHLKDADPAFRAAVEAVERIQRSRSEAVVAEVRPAEPRLEEARPVERVYAGEKSVERPAEAAAATVAPVPTAPAAREMEQEPVVADVEPVAVEPERTEEAPGESDDVRGWKELFKRTPEVGVAPVETPAEVPAPVFSERTETPVLFFEDRKRPRVAVPVREAEVASPAEVAVAETAPPVEPAAAKPPIAVEAAAFESLERTEISAGVERHEEDRGSSWAESGEETVAAPAEELETLAQAPAPEWTWTRQDREAEPAEPDWAAAMEEPAAISPPPVAESAVVDAEVETVEPAFMPAAEPVAVEEPAEALVVEALREPEELAVAVPVQETASAVLSEPVQPAARVREPAAPRMEWFTLRFKGTTERVLRIVPGDEDYVAETQEETAPVAFSAASEEEPEALAEEPIPTEPEETLAEGASVEEPLEAVEPEAVEPEAVEPVAVEPVDGVNPVEMVEEPVLPEVEPLPVAESAVAEPVGEDAGVVAPEFRGVTADVFEIAEAERVEVYEQVALVAELGVPAAEAGFGPDGEVPELPAEWMTQVDGRLDVASLESAPEVAPGMMGKAMAEVAAEEMVMRPVEVPVVRMESASEMVAQVAPEPVVRDKRGWVVTDATPEGVVDSAWKPTRLARGEDALRQIEALAPARLVHELRSRSAANEARTPEHWIRRSVGAPVEERPETRPVSRRWELLSRFDTKIEPASETELTPEAAADEDRARA